MRILKNEEIAEITFPRVLEKLSIGSKEKLKEQPELKELFDLFFKNDWFLKEINYLCIIEYLESIKKSEHLVFKETEIY